ncbi:UDP-glucose dehydrogenase family protein [Fictibacillus sp. NPDC058756]|uniref:UDP-glucose dehydrogenase family protein n=1 Tax=Fictibacillus sp. NPDC058756 TaxID=3346625 RepID=UPI003678A9DD
MKILIIGTGYVGTTTALTLCELGHQVTGYDVDPIKIASLQNKKLHFYEPGLKELLVKHLHSGNIQFTENIKHAVQQSEIIFICVGTPQQEDGSANLEYVQQAAAMIGNYLNNYKIIVNKSTVPVGTAEKVTKWIEESLVSPTNFDVISNPEFLREGTALQDSLNPERIVIGSKSERATNIMKKLYCIFKAPFVHTTPQTAELIKYAANSFLATKISFINEMAKLCENVNVDIKDVAYGIGLDSRIGMSFLQAGIGYGGSCFPKDVLALLSTAQQYNTNLSLLEKVNDINNTQPLYMIEKIKNKLREIKGKKIVILGLSFKPQTDDIRESPAIKIIEELHKQSANIVVHDPVAKLPKTLSLKITQSTSIHSLLENADALIICTDWPEYETIDWLLVKKKMRNPYIFDGRNMLNASKMTELGFYYEGIGYR